MTNVANHFSYGFPDMNEILTHFYPCFPLTLQKILISDNKEGGGGGRTDYCFYYYILFSKLYILRKVHYFKKS